MPFDTQLFSSIAQKVKYSKDETAILKLKRISFVDSEGRQFIAVQQNPLKKSSWGLMAARGRKVVQIKDKATDNYVAVVVEGNVTLYAGQE
jgi:hypothetical protein